MVALFLDNMLSMSAGKPSFFKVKQTKSSHLCVAVYIIPEYFTGNKRDETVGDKLHSINEPDSFPEAENTSPEPDIALINLRKHLLISVQFRRLDINYNFAGYDYFGITKTSLPPLFIIQEVETVDYCGMFAAKNVIQLLASPLVGIIANR